MVCLMRNIGIGLIMLAMLLLAITLPELISYGFGGYDESKVVLEFYLPALLTFFCSTLGLLLLGPWFFFHRPLDKWLILEPAE